MRAALVSTLLMVSLSPAFAGACEKVSLGAGVQLAEATPVAAILDRPTEYVGKEVRVEGEIREVCKMAGCWMELAATDGARVLKVQVEDGAIVFPVAAKGKQAAAQGKIEDLEMSRDKYVRFRRHAAEEHGESFDEATLSGDGPFHVYQLAGTGAEICN